MKASKLLSIFFQTLFGVVLINVTLFAEENKGKPEPEHFPVDECAMSHIERVNIQEKRAIFAHKIAKDEPLSEEDLANLSDAEQAEIVFNESEHFPVGERAMSHIERVNIQEKRAIFAHKIAKDEPLSEEDLANLSDAEQEEIIFNESENETCCKEHDKENILVSREKGVLKPKFITYTSTHDGALHYPISFSIDTVQLEDGSIWVVNFNDRRKILDWMSGDTVIITPNTTWLSTEDYRLVNLNTCASVKVNLSLGPFCGGDYTHWIVAIDYCHREVRLEDGSVWKISFWDANILDSWSFDDVVIIGVNKDGYLSDSNPNILINITKTNYAIGTCIY